jgi:long-chain fatty acid transport protein
MKNHILALSAAALAFVAAPRAHASAFQLFEQNASGLGNAFAGSAAVAEDASTVWWNPAGMARLPSGRHVLFAGHLIAPSLEFSNRASQPSPLGNTALTGNGGDAGDTSFVPNAYFATSLAAGWNFGVGVNVPFGLSTEYDAGWIGRFQGIRSEVKTLNINPAISYRLGERTSLGIGVSYQRGEIDLLTAVPLGVGIESRNSTSVDGDAWGFNAGVLFILTPETRLGIHYRSSLDYEMEGTTSVAGVPAAASNVKLDLETPASLSFSVAHRMNERLELLGDITWTEWSRIDRLPLVRTSGPASGATLDTLVFNFDDTWRVAIGANYKWSGPWTLKAGVAFDQSPVPDAATRSVRLPDEDRYWLSAGASYQLSRNGRLDFGYTFVSIKDADINNDQRAVGRGLVNGTYDASTHILSVQYQHSF